MRSTVFAAILATLLVSPASGQLESAPSDRLMDRLSVEVFSGYMPGATDWVRVEMDFTSPFSTTTRHRLETVRGGTALTGVGVRYDVVSWARITGAVVYAPSDDRSINLHSSSRVTFNGPDDLGHLHWQTAGGGTTIGRVGLEVPPFRSDLFDIWVGGGAGLVRATSGSEDEIPEQVRDVPSRFLATWTAPTAFLTGRLEAPLIGPVGVTLAAGHHWTWWDGENLMGGVEDFFEDGGILVGVTSDGMQERMWLGRLGLTYQPN